ncbi:MAG: serine--tRNA ligase, partial [Chloroflexi bacterium]|nr:serine--tRNA ligase [Chloroflexota bacterium]
MIDIKTVRENPELLKDGLTRRQMDTDVVDTLVRLDEQRRVLLTQVEELKAERNKVSKEISTTRDKTERETKIVSMRKVGDKIEEMDAQVKSVEVELDGLIASVPNIPDASVPLGKDES